VNVKSGKSEIGRESIGERFAFRTAKVSYTLPHHQLRTLCHCYWCQMTGAL